jgi:outer membrane protein assembly factor BamB
MQDEQGPPGPRCTPLVDDDRVYAQSGHGLLGCFALEDGHTFWRVSFQKDFGASFLGEDSKVPGAAEHGYTAAPVIDAERLIACVGGTNGAGIVCFDKKNGRVLWKSQDDLAAYAAPIVATLAGIKHAVCFTVEGLVGLQLEDGRPLWRWPLKTSYGRNVTTPVVVDNWVIVGSYQTGLVGVKLASQGPALNVEHAWTNKAGAMNFSSPVVVGHLLYGLGPAKNVICVEIDTGKITWSKEGYFTTAPNMAYASFLVLGDNILMTTDGGLAVLIAADTTTCRELGRAQVCGMNWCSPAYAQGQLFIRDGLKTGGHLYGLNLLP